MVYIRVKMLKLPVFLLLACVLWIPSSEAVEFVSEKNVHISNIHTIDDDLFTAGSNITIDGEVRGDLFAAGYKVITNGIIESSANIGCQSYSQSGEINGSLRVFAETIDIDGSIGRSAIVCGSSCKIGKNTIIEKELYFYGAILNLDGTVLENVEIQGESVHITGTIEGNVTIEAENIYINPPALIKGDFKYISSKEANIDTKSGVTILGNTTWNLPEKDDAVGSGAFISNTVTTTSKLLAALLFGIIIILIGRKYINEMVHQLQTRFAVATATGLLSIVIIGISVIILLFALILLIVGFGLISDGESFGGAIFLIISTLLIPITSFITVSGGVIIYSGKIIVAILLGYLIAKKLHSSPKHLSKTQLLIGLVLLYLVFAIPYLGFLMFILVTIVGAGAIVLGFKHCNVGLNKFQSSEQVGK